MSRRLLLAIGLGSVVLAGIVIWIVVHAKRDPVPDGSEPRAGTDVVAPTAPPSTAPPSTAPPSTAPPSTAPPTGGSAAAAGGTPTAPTGTAPTGTAPTGTAPVAPPQSEVQTKMAAAKQALDAGDFARAQTLAVELLEPTRFNPKVVQVAVTAACGAGDRDAANAYFAHASPETHALLIERCKASGITLNARSTTVRPPVPAHPR